MKGGLGPIHPDAVEHALAAFVSVQLDDVDDMRRTWVIRIFNVYKVSRVVSDALQWRESVQRIKQLLLRI